MNSQDKFNPQDSENNSRNTSNTQDKSPKATEAITTSSGIKNSLKIPGGIELPKGGGAIRGIGEKAEVNPANGSGTVSIPLPLTPGRSGFIPQLALSYSSGAGNSEFGLGWNVGLPEITRKTDKELPRYWDADESDTFILSGAEDLVPVADSNGTIIETSEGANKIRKYYPRTEGLNAKIERITKPSGEIYWRITSKDNIISLYGFTSSSHIADPEKPEKHIFSWRLERTMDSLGNYTEYEYAHDDTAEYSSIYLSSVKYGNAVPVANIESTYSGGFYFSLEFDYRDNRFDAFSVFKPGFEVRNTKLCTSIRMIHNINPANKKVKELTLVHSDTTGLNLLMSAKLTGYDSANNATGLPQIDFEYSLPQVSGKTKELDRQDLENIPAGLNGEAGFSDLWNEGISGVLVKSSNAWYYKPNLGNRKWFDENGNDEIDLGKLFVLKEFPGLTLGSMESAQLTDIDGDGLNEIQILSGNIKGWHSFDESGKLSPFVPFKQIPDIDMNDPNIQMIDLNGDGYPDMLFSGNDCFLASYSKAKDGYGELQRISKAISEEKGPRVIFNEQQQSIFIADMSGDGLNDIVRIKNGSVCYWPNLGYGRFGKKRRMKKAPTFDYADMFDSSRIRLADIDGSGTTDILYLGTNITTYWKNQSGNEWSEGMLIPNFPKTGSLTNVSVFDIEGNGTSAIVWSSPLPGTRDCIKYIELTSGIKPFLLTSIKNNMGAERNLFYAPSTKFYLQDKRAGKPWITKLGFPVHVVERMEIIDNPTASRYVNRYAYHHGYFDGYEREFHGFGMVEQWDTDDYGASTSLSTHTAMSLSGAEGDTPPVYTKTWFHTGFYRNADNISDLYSHEYYQENQEWRLPDTTVPEGLTPQEKREATRVLKGSMLRQEVYSQDGSDKQNIPYTVTENSYLVKVRQRKLENKHAVFMVLPEESIALNYERELSDPRIVHTLNLEYDYYGNPLKQATAAYKRLTGNTAGQNKTLVSLQETAYLNSSENSGFYRIGTPLETINNEITGFASRSTKLSIAEISAAEKTKIQHQQIFYYVESNGNLAVGDFGEVDKRALQYRTETLAFTNTTLNSFCSYNPLANAPTVPEVKAILREAGYTERNAEFWQPSEALDYDPNKFYLPYRQINSLGNITELTYDIYKLLPVSVKDALSYITNIVNDYISMQPVKVTDHNGNVVEMQLNGLGMPVKQAVNNGKAYTAADFEGDTINSPTVEYEYYLNSWTDTGKPVYAVSKAKTLHGSNNNRLESYEYTDGLERAILVKATAENGDAYDSNGNIVPNSTTRFTASGRIVYNNKGDIVKQYEPWYSNNPDYEANSVAMEIGVTPIMHYDPPGRLIKTDFPDNTTTRVEFNAWEQLNYDQNDCDTDSPHYNTPQKVYISPLGTAYRTDDNNGTYGIVQTTQTIDILGQVLEVEDALGRRITQNLYDMAGQLIATRNIDSGLRQILYNPAQLPIYTWDNRKQRIRNTYDAMLRPLLVLLKEDTSTETTVQKIEYGTNAAKRNISRIENIYAQDGKTVYDLYDFKGNILTLKKQFAQAYNTALNYGGTVSLQAEIYTVQTTYDALNRPVNITQPDSTVVINTYDKGGLLKQVSHNAAAYISNIAYNARGQRERIQYGNDSTTSYEYNPDNFRLTRLLTTKQSGVQKLQDLNYEYDSVGNITKVTDNAQQVHYFNNSTINPVNTYEYDALYRLIKAAGREKKGLSAPGWEDFTNDLPVPNTDPNALQNYTHNYSYDKLGNILSDHWKTYEYASENNYLLGNNDVASQFTYDEHGNMLAMPHLSNMQWNYKDQLLSATSGTLTSYYNYDSEGNRSRKVVEKQGGIKEERYYVGSYEIYKITGSLDNHERSTVKLADDTKVFALVETRIGENALIRFQYDNHLGSSCLELDGNANIISYEEYHPFGTTSYRAGRSQTEASLKRYKYCGKERDEETGLYYYGARYYAGWLCRFVSTDPMKEERTWVNPYNYCQNNPVTRTDPTGALDYDPPKTYVVQEGDSPSQIAEKFGIDIWDLARNNQGELSGGGFFNDIGNGDYSEYWVEGAGSSWSLKPGDILNINNTKKRLNIQFSTKIRPFLPQIESTQSSMGAGYYIGLSLSIASMVSSTATTFGNLSKKISLFNQGKFIANYNGIAREWSLKFYGNKYVPNSFVTAEKAKFLFNLKSLNMLKMGGIALGVTGISLSTVEFVTSKDPGKKMESFFDISMGVVGLFGLVGALSSLLYFGMKPLMKKDAEIRTEITKDFSDIGKGFYNFNTMPSK